MENSNKVCRICLNAISSHTFIGSIEFVIGMLQAVVDVDQMVQWSLNCSEICPECSQTLTEIYDFKNMCFKSEETILRKVSKIQSNVKLNLKDIVLWTDNTPKPLKYDVGKVCRACLRLFDKSIKLTSENSLNSLKKHMTELELDLTLNPDVCADCTNILYKWDHFKTVCSSTEKFVKHYCNTFNINTENVNPNSLLEYIKTCNLQMVNQFSYEEINFTPSCEEIDSKIFCEELNSVDRYIAQKDFTTDMNVDDNDFRLIIQETSEIELKPIKRNGVRLYSCPKCKAIVNKIKDHLKQHAFNFKISYQCLQCNFRHISDEHLKKHMVTHKQCPSETYFFNCTLCSFQSKQKGNLKTHMLTHKSPKEIQMHKCHICKFQSRQKGNLTTHLLVHKKHEEIEMHKCSYCKYQARQKGNLQTHILKKHKLEDDRILEEALFYKCKKCSYKAKHKPSLKKHMLTHSN